MNNNTVGHRECTASSSNIVFSHKISNKKINRCRSFHLRYLELCRAKNYTALPEIKAKNNSTSVLDFFCDKLRVDDWLMVIESLHYDQILQNLAIRLRKNSGGVVEHLDTEKKAKLFKQKPTVYTKFIFTGIIEAISNCIQFNKNLHDLILEALPLSEKYVVSIAKALSLNEAINLKTISFQRCSIGDKGCEAICSTIKHLAGIETINLSDCEITAKGAEYIADMIKFQKICRYSEGWQKSLRYRDVDPDTIPGLRAIIIANNPNIGDEGMVSIVEILKEDVWIKIIDMERCGLTDTGANHILDCLEINKYIIDFNIRGNSKVSKFLQRNIREQLGKDDDYEGGFGNGTTDEGKKGKVSVSVLKERLKFLEEQIASEKVLRKQVELLNEKLHEQILAYETQLAEQTNRDIPDGFVLVNHESLDSIIRERNDLQKVASAIRISKTNSNYIKKLSKVRKAKSETKCPEVRPKKKISKSDHEFGTEERNIVRLNNCIKFERNIGDTAANAAVLAASQLTARIENSNRTVLNRDNISSTSGSSSGSDTIRNHLKSVDNAVEPFKLFIRKKKLNVDKMEPLGVTKCPSPRSLFLGICD